MPEAEHKLYPVAGGEQVQGLTQVSERVVRKKDRQQESRKRRVKKRTARSQDRPVEPAEPGLVDDEDGHIDFRA